MSLQKERTAMDAAQKFVSGRLQRTEQSTRNDPHTPKRIRPRYRRPDLLSELRSEEAVVLI